MAVQLTLLENGNLLLQEVKIKLLGKKTNKDPVSEEEVGICSKWETGGGIKQGAKGHGFLDEGACP